MFPSSIACSNDDSYTARGELANASQMLGGISQSVQYSYDDADAGLGVMTEQLADIDERIESCSTDSDRGVNEFSELMSIRNEHINNMSGLLKERYKKDTGMTPKTAALLLGTAAACAALTLVPGF